jgi:hypothetical protein
VPVQALFFLNVAREIVGSSLHVTGQIDSISQLALVRVPFYFINLLSSVSHGVETCAGGDESSRDSGMVGRRGGGGAAGRGE